MHRPAMLVTFGALLVGCAHARPTPATEPVSFGGRDPIDLQDRGAAQRPAPASAAHETPVPRIVHRADPFQFAYATNADVGLAISDEGHASMFAPSDGRVRATLRISDGSFDQAIRLIADDGSRAIVGSLRETDDPDRLALWNLDSDTAVDLLAGLSSASPRYVVADPGVRTIFVALEGDGSSGSSSGVGEASDQELEREATLRYAEIDLQGNVRCTSSPLPRRGPEELLVAADGSALFLDAVDEDVAVRIDARTCTITRLGDVDFVLATRPSSGQMVTRDADGTLAFRSPRDGALLARIPLQHQAMRAIYDPTGTYVLFQAASLAMVLSAVDGRVAHPAVAIRGNVVSLASDAASFVAVTRDAATRIDAATGQVVPDPAVAARVEPPAGAGERMVWDAIAVPTRGSLVVVTTNGLVEWSSDGARELSCDGGAVLVLAQGATLRAFSPSSICDLSANTVVHRQVLATSDDGSLALVVGDADAHGEHPIALMDLATGSLRASLPMVPGYAEGRSVARRQFTADARFAIAAGYDRVALVDTRRGRVVAKLPSHIRRVRGRTPDGRAFVVEGEEPETHRPLRLRVDPRRPTRLEAYDGPVDDGLVGSPPQLVCREGVGHVVAPGHPLDGTVSPICLTGKLAFADSGETLVVVAGEATHLIRHDGSDHVVLRTVFAEEEGLPTYSFATDLVGHVHVDPEGLEQVLIRRAGDARTAELAPSSPDPELLARVGRLLRTR